ncbi:hypothetical protein HWN75_25925, partial [Escherichia coli]|nr:hypothetical protein [Escherichia coli]
LFQMGVDRRDCPGQAINSLALALPVCALGRGHRSFASHRLHSSGSTASVHAAAGCFFAILE